MKSKFLCLFFVFTVLFGIKSTVLSSQSLAASVIAKVDVSQQIMRVYVNGKRFYTWRVSTGRRGYHTPRGSYRPTFLKRMHYSKKYYNSPMPYSIFFKGGYAIHGTKAIKRLGRPASHGCIRLHPAAARELFNLVKRNRSRARIVIKN